MGLGWLKSMSGSRALQLTSPGRVGLSEIFQIEISNEGCANAAARIEGGRGGNVVEFPTLSLRSGMKQVS